MSSSENEIRIKLNDFHNGSPNEAPKSWREIAEFDQYKGISFATLSAYARGRTIINRKHRRILGLPEIVKTPVCEHCGIAHTYDCQTQSVKNAEPPRNLRRATIYPGTPPDEVIRKLERIGHKVRYE